MYKIATIMYIILRQDYIVLSFFDVYKTCTFFYIRLEWHPGALCSVLEPPKWFRRCATTLGMLANRYHGVAGLLRPL